MINDSDEDVIYGSDEESRQPLNRSHNEDDSDWKSIIDLEEYKPWKWSQNVFVCWIHTQSFCNKGQSPSGMLMVRNLKI